jgi:hypothetical protein
LRYLIVVRLPKPEVFPYTGRYPRRSSNKGWPLVEHRDWRGALVGVMAHGGQHIRQFQHKWPLSEMECERIEAKRLEEYRAANAPAAATDPE